MKMISRKPKPTCKSATEVAVGLLARREHSASELQRKLRQKGCAADDIKTSLECLQEQGLLSDQRFVESYVNMRKNRGYGPLRILAELQEKGVSAELAETMVYHPDNDWLQVLQHVYAIKYPAIKYPGKPAVNYQERGKRIASLQNRGFPLELVMALLRR